MVARPGHGRPDPRDALLRWTALPLPLQVAFLATGTLALALVVDALAGERGGPLALWPPAGLITVALVLSPVRRWPVLLAGMLAGALVFNLLDRNPAAVIAGLLVAAAAQAVASAVIVRATGRGRGRPDLAFARDAWALVAGAIGGPVLGGLIGAATLALAGEGAFGRSWLVLAMAAVTGVLVIAPVVFAVPSDGGRLPVARRPLEGAACLGLAAAMPVGALWTSDLPLGWLVAVAPLWAALRLGPFGAMAATGVTGILVTALTVRGQGYYAAATARPDEALVLAQAFVAVVVVIGALLAAITAERHRTAERLHHVERMEGIGRLAGAVAHDFNTVLTVIGGHGTLALEKATRGEDVSEELRRVLEASDKAALLTNRLLAFSHRRAERSGPVVLNRVVAGSEALMRRTVGDAVVLETDLDPDAGCVTCGASQLEQILLDLARNARDAMPRGGTLRVTTEAVGGERVRLTVADTGKGMDAATRARAFDPFFTTKGGSTGLGLATVYGVVEQCGGRVELHSAPGAGTTVRLDLPRAADAPSPAPPPARRLPRGGETVLIAEDEPSLRLLVRIALSGEGYTLLEAADGREALAVAASHDGPIDLLLTDIVMPRMSGPELADRLGVPVLYMSGYAERDVTPIAALDADNFIAKPFSPRELARRVRERLDRPASLRPGAATATPHPPRS